MKKSVVIILVIVILLIAGVGYYYLANYSDGNMNIRVSDSSITGIMAVYITFNQVAIHGNKTGWTNYSFSSQTINILGLTINNSKSIGNFSLSAQKYTMLRIYIQSVSVTTPAGNITLKLSSPFVFINHPINISAHSTTDVVIEFNLQQSINMESNVFTPYVGIFIQ
ncbi:MAG: DUF4382 domain-containing protein [Thermoplasmata archaeon]